jgi:hypothetical protein
MHINDDAHSRTQVDAYHSPFLETLVMDTDTCVRSRQVMHMFAPLQDFDFVAVWECCALWGSPNRTRFEARADAVAYGTGWEPNTGVFTIRQSARQLVSADRTHECCCRRRSMSLQWRCMRLTPWVQAALPG